MKKKKYLPLYYEWRKEGELPTNGLCNCFKGDAIFELVKPNFIGGYWGEPDKTVDTKTYTHGFGPLRQNIVLLMAAMNNEL